MILRSSSTTLMGGGVPPTPPRPCHPHVADAVREQWCSLRETTIKNHRGPHMASSKSIDRSIDARSFATVGEPACVRGNTIIHHCNLFSLYETLIYTNLGWDNDESPSSKPASFLSFPLTRCLEPSSITRIMSSPLASIAACLFRLSSSRLVT